MKQYIGMGHALSDIEDRQGQRPEPHGGEASRQTGVPAPCPYCNAPQVRKIVAAFGVAYIYACGSKLSPTKSSAARSMECHYNGI